MSTLRGAAISVCALIALSGRRLPIPSNSAATRSKRLPKYCPGLA